MTSEHADLYTIDVQRETLIPLSRASSLPTEPSKSQLASWIKTGILNRATGRRIFLPSKRRGVTTYTSQEAFLWFIEQSSLSEEA